MTYIQLVNLVLRELRIAQVTVLTADYTALIGQYVNKAKQEVEDAWKWSALRNTLTFNTAVGTQNYNLGTSGVAIGGTTNERSHLLYDKYNRPIVFNTTLKSQCTEYSREIAAQYQILAQSPNTQPGPFYQIRGNSGITLSFYPAPDAIYAMAARFWIPQADLSAASDVLTVPATPVWKRALAMAAAERGGGQGETVEALKASAQVALTDSILLDASLEELTVTAD